MTVENVHVGLPGLSPSLPFLRRVLVLVGSSGACWMGPRVIFFPFLPSSFSTSAQRQTHTLTHTHRSLYIHTHSHTLTGLYTFTGLSLTESLSLFFSLSLTLSIIHSSSHSFFHSLLPLFIMHSFSLSQSFCLSPSS